VPTADSCTAAKYALHSVTSTARCWRNQDTKRHREGLTRLREAQPRAIAGRHSTHLQNRDPIEAGLRDRAREFLQAMLEAELDEVLDRSRYARRAKRSTGGSEAPAGVTGHRQWVPLPHCAQEQTWALGLVTTAGRGSGRSNTWRAV
jgi:hypothetical protein